MRALGELLLYIRCEAAKLRRKPLFAVLAASSVLLPLAFAFFLSDPPDSRTAVIQTMASLIQLSAYVVLIPAVAVLAANLLFEEQDNDMLKNLLCVPVSKARLAVAKLLMLAVLLAQGWQPVGYWPLFAVCLGQGVFMWAGALPCVLLMVVLNKSYLLSVLIAFFYTIVNYLVPTALPALTAVPLGLNAGTLLPGALTLRWYLPFLSDGPQPPLVQQLMEYTVTTPQALAVTAAEAAVFMALIAWVYRRQGC